MARDETVILPSDGEWIELTKQEDATGAVALQNLGFYTVRIQATTDSTPPPTSSNAGWKYEAGDADERTLQKMYPGLPTPVRLWARSENGGAVKVSYA